VRNKEKHSTSVYTNALHESLINKDGDLLIYLGNAGGPNLALV